MSVMCATATPTHSLTSPLNMEVEWCLQGGSATFTGFFTEFLGFSSGLRALLPKTRLVPSEFPAPSSSVPSSAFSELAVPPESTLYGELFDKERDNLLHLVSNTHVPVSMKDQRYLKFMSQLGEADPELECTSPEQYFPPPYDSPDKRYLKSSRPLVPVDGYEGLSRVGCCKICASEPLCMAWSHSGEHDCQLHTRFEKLPLQHHDMVKSTNNDESFAAAIKKRKFAAPRAVIFHGTTCGYQNMSITEQKRDINTIYVGRYMFERENIYKNMSPEEYKVIMCLLRMDEVWVPSQWMKNELELTSQVMGFNFPPMTIVPEAVDTHLFNPASAILGSNDNNDGMNIHKNDIFQFVSIFKWEDRKGWDILLRAYWTAFSREDNVVLRLHTYRPSFLSRHGQVNISENLVQFAQREFGKDMTQLAHVSLGDTKPLESFSCHNGGDKCRADYGTPLEGPVRSENLNRVQMRQLLHSSDAFVLPTRGEGWCLPAAEAMAMALPVIITNFSGPTAYATDENAYLIPYKTTRSDGFAEPNEEVLVSLMKHVRSSLQESKLKGIKARETMAALSPQAVVTIMADRLRDLAKMRGWED